ncbi:hypothetical protein [Carboxylicivirga taeanensis]|uniref:hypothetical protein n=1 Tax=Carboxylicivirga taeanensis TaxID=1416875 RepID=UPI003F6DAE78
MKTTFLVLALTLFSVTLWAQSAKEEIDYIQSIFGMEKKALIGEVVKPEEAQKAAFWKLYDDYEAARKDLGKKRLNLLLAYGDNYEGLSNDEAADFLKKVLALIKQNDKLLERYVKKISKTINPVTALQFHQIEMYILSEIRASLADNLPFPEAKK